MRSGFGRKIVIFIVFLAAVGAVIFCVLSAHETVPVHRLQHHTETAGSTVSEVPVHTDITNINIATQEELEALPGIGPVLAERILAYRDVNGDFYDVGELREIDGIGEKLLQDLLPYICT